MFPILTFWILVISVGGWLIFSAIFWEKMPARIGGVVFACMCALLAVSLNTPDCTTWNDGCNYHEGKRTSQPPETMTNPHGQLGEMYEPGKDERTESLEQQVRLLKKTIEGTP